jgi:hypothetical protein
LNTEGWLPSKILVRVIESFDVELPDPPGPGHRFLFSNDLVLERYDDSTPGKAACRRMKTSALQARIQDS